jgi:tRNA splicing endonuclease
MNSENKIIIAEQNILNKTQDEQKNMPINVLMDKITQITKSKNKNDFIKKYNEYHEEIKKIDEIIYKPNSINSDTDIKLLFEMLKDYDVLIENNNITVQEYKKMCDLIELIENKLKNSSMDIDQI